jgi:hypothetical protein
MPNMPLDPLMMDFPEQPEADAPAEGQTMTLMIRGIPCSKTQEDLMQTLAEHGLDGKFDFLYLPRPGRSLSNLGYAFVNFPNPADASQCLSSLDGLALDPTKSTKICSISPARIQGLAMLRKHFRKTAVSRCTRGPIFFKVGANHESANPIGAEVGKNAQKTGEPVFYEYDSPLPSEHEAFCDYDGPSEREALYDYEGPIEHDAPLRSMPNTVANEGQRRASHGAIPRWSPAPEVNMTNGSSYIPNYAVNPKVDNPALRVHELLKELEQLMPVCFQTQDIVNDTLRNRRHSAPEPVPDKLTSVPTPQRQAFSQNFNDHSPAFSQNFNTPANGHSLPPPQSIHPRRDNMERPLNQAPFMANHRCMTKLNYPGYLVNDSVATRGNDQFLHEKPGQSQMPKLKYAAPPGLVWEQPPVVSAPQQSFEREEQELLRNMQRELQRQQLQKMKRLQELQQMQQMQQMQEIAKTSQKHQEPESVMTRGVPRFCRLESHKDDMYFTTDIPGVSYSI